MLDYWINNAGDRIKTAMDYIKLNRPESLNHRLKKELIKGVPYYDFFFFFIVDD